MPLSISQLEMSLHLKKAFQLTLMKFAASQLTKRNQSPCAFVVRTVKGAILHLCSSDYCWRCVHNHLTDRVQKETSQVPSTQVNIHGGCMPWHKLPE